MQTILTFLDDLIIQHPAENMEFEIKLFKEIQVTESFLGINENVRGCQEREMYDDCINHSYYEYKNSCGCLPLSLKINKNVFLKSFFCFQLNHYLQDSMCTQSSEDKCLFEKNFTECKRYLVIVIQTSTAKFL